MPELPEVETTLRGIAPHMERRSITEIIVRNPALRWPIPAEVAAARGQKVIACRRRAKYLLVELEQGGLRIDLGMSGSLRICGPEDVPRKHDHVDIVMDSGRRIRFNDPRRFGALLWWDRSPERHAPLRDLGPEPLSDGFSGAHLWRLSRSRKAAVKSFIMDGRVVVGVGNIYASEALFMSGIHPSRPAGRISMVRYEALAAAIRDVLAHAIRRGGTTLRDFVNSEGNPGYFAQELTVYEREGNPCFHCQTPIRRKVIGQRSSYYCPSCQR